MNGTKNVTILVIPIYRTLNGKDITKSVIQRQNVSTRANGPNAVSRIYSKTAQ